MKKGDGTEMGEVVQSILMPSLLINQILRVEGGTGQGKGVTILKKSSDDTKYLCMST